METAKILFIKRMVLCELYHSSLSTYDLASHLKNRQLIQRLEASSQLEWRDWETVMFSVHFLPIILDVMPSKLPRYVHCVGPTYCVLALLVKRMFFLLSTYFLVATSYKRMRWTTSFYNFNLALLVWLFFSCPKYEIFLLIVPPIKSLHCK